MNLQVVAVELLGQSSEVLEGLGKGETMAAECVFAAAKYREAAKRLSVEPCGLNDIVATRLVMAECLDQGRRILALKSPAKFHGWAQVAMRGIEAAYELLKGLEAFYAAIQLDHPEVTKRVPGPMQRLLPAGWWGSR